MNTNKALFHFCSKSSSTLISLASSSIFSDQANQRWMALSPSMAVASTAVTVPFRSSSFGSLWISVSHRQSRGCEDVDDDEQFNLSGEIQLYMWSDQYLCHISGQTSQRTNWVMTKSKGSEELPMQLLDSTHY